MNEGKLKKHADHINIQINLRYPYTNNDNNCLLYEITNRRSCLQSILFHCQVHSTCFGCFTHPSSGVQFLTVSTATGTNHTVRYNGASVGYFIEYIMMHGTINIKLFIGFRLVQYYTVGRVGQSVQRLTMGWKFRGQNPGETRFSGRPDRPWGPPSLL